MMRFVSAGVLLLCSTVSTWGADYATSVLSHSPLGYYRMNEAAGTIAIDSALPAQNGTYTNGPLLNQAGPPFPGFSGSNTAVQFDGTNDFVFNNSLPFSNFTTYSAEGWVNNTRPTNASAITGYVLSRRIWRAEREFRRIRNYGNLWQPRPPVPLQYYSDRFGRPLDRFDQRVASRGVHEIGHECRHLFGRSAPKNSSRSVCKYLELEQFLHWNTLRRFISHAGRIDEVAVYDNSVLTGKQINAHYNAAFSTGLYSINNANFELQDLDVSAAINLNQTSTGDGAWSNDIVRGWTGNNTQSFGVFDPTNVNYAGTTSDANPVLGGDGDQVGYITTTGQLISVSQTLPDPIQAGRI